MITVESSSTPSLPRRDLTRSTLVVNAEQCAREAFAGHLRKAPPGLESQRKPFFSHLDAVARTLEIYGYSPEVVAAGYLHDHVEDLPQSWTKTRVAREFGERVAELVDWVTQQDKSLSWEERNLRYLDRLRSAPAEALALSAADKLSNISDLLPFLRAGIPIHQILKRDWHTNSKKFHELVELFRGKIHPLLLQDLERALQSFDEYGGQLQETDR